MTLPRNKGIRKLKIDNIKYYWTCAGDSAKKELKVTIGKVAEPNRRIVLSVKQTAIPSLPENEDIQQPPAGIIKVTPELIKRTIKFACGCGWESQEKIKPFLVKLDNNFFEEID